MADADDCLCRPKYAPSDPRCDNLPNPHSEIHTPILNVSKPLRKGTLSGGIASLNVGTPETSFDVHLELLCDSSPYFNGLFNDSSTGVPSVTIRFPDDDPDTFTEFLNWVYRGTIFQAQLHPRLIELFRLWVLADRFEVPELQNLVVTLCKKRFDDKNGVLGTNTINYVYDNTLPGSPLRRMIVDKFAQRVTKEKFWRYREGVSSIFFLRDLCEFLLGKRDIIDPGIDPSPDFEALYFVDPS